MAVQVVVRCFSLRIQKSTIRPIQSCRIRHTFLSCNFIPIACIKLYGADISWEWSSEVVRYLARELDNPLSDKKAWAVTSVSWIISLVKKITFTGEYQCLKDSLLSAAQRGKDLLAKVRVQPPEVIPYNALDIEDARQRQQRQRRLNGNENIVRQMMAEIAQHERDLDSFWLLHKERLVSAADIAH